ncbi:OPT oligopeptide transporter protein-domain-containing protein [Phakopsora pachyrhizi]|uniref:OPT oligopeptide transporter protein-domain-containing protein n=1 Tax=Phakopsora pachyrhizi TaxID=170000 RepID=A0AAV0BFM9_PHAPC|nr:OPT oligopeptide transporter protein-domain-containing protein [Phakopsora pachyrhizi]CAH7684196.1 OPT oligopeptide transporter protein-domain-containing protein [Phakopsora pachyrhizi]
MEPSIVRYTGPNGEILEEDESLFVNDYLLASAGEPFDQHNHQTPLPDGKTANERLNNSAAEPEKKNDDGFNYITNSLKELKHSNLPEELILVQIDDNTEDAVVTVRALLVGILEGAVGAVILQLFLFKSAPLPKMPILSQIFTVIFGFLFSLIPGPKWWNPGPFGAKESVFAAIISTSASSGAPAIEMIVTQYLFFNRINGVIPNVMIHLSSQLVGLSFAGLFQPILVYPARMLYPKVFPSVALYNLLHGSKEKKDKKLKKFFSKILGAITFYQVLPTYVMPALQGISFFCLTMPQNELITNIFGGADSQEGMGLFSACFDWYLVGDGGPLYTPFRSQLHILAGFVIGKFLFPLAYSRSWFSAGAKEGFPFLSGSLFTKKGKLYPVEDVIDEDGNLISEALKPHGPPSFTATHITGQIAVTIAATSAVTNLFLTEWRNILATLTNSKPHGTQDPHRLTVLNSYKDFPRRYYLVMAAFAIGLAITASTMSNGQISPAGIFLAILTPSFLTLAIGTLAGITGGNLRLGGVVPMIGGLVLPQNAIGNMWFSTYAAATASQGLQFISDLKFAQYMHLPPITVTVAQLTGSFVALCVNIAMMNFMLRTNEEELSSLANERVSPGVIFQELESQAVAWGVFSSQLLFLGKPYSFVAISIIIGFLSPLPFYFANKIWPNKNLNAVNIPLLANWIAVSARGRTSGHSGKIIVGGLSQVWARWYHRKWYWRYNYILSAALDSGTYLVIVVISVFFKGFAGIKIEIPNYFLNPTRPTAKDYCILTGIREEVYEEHVSTFL